MVYTAPMLLAPFLLLGASVGTAWARDPDCPELRAADLTALADQVDQLFAEKQVAAARRALVFAEKKLPCVLDVVKTEDVARFALRYAYALAGDVDTPEAQRWALLARALDPSLPWPAYIPAGHQVRELAIGELPAPTTLEGKGLSVPDGGGVFLDGRFLEGPKAEPGVPHLLQVGDAGGNLETTWIDGTAFPEDLLGPPAGAPPTLPAWYSADGSKVKIQRPKAEWSEARRANLERAVGFAAVGGALYGTALSARSAYDVRPTDGLFVATNGAAVAGATAGATTLVFLGAALFGR
jgi:hypothetical protein